jgi:streptogramin lyase
MLLASGCGGGSSFHPGPTSPSPENAAVNGKVFGGQQPISGAKVQLYVAGGGSYGSGAKLLLPATYTDANGAFSFTASYTCPSDSVPAYLVASGGNPGTGKDNSAIGLLAALGTCGSLSSAPSIVINEVTTVAAAWALAPFLGTDGQMGTSSGNALGLVSGYASVNNLVDLSTGTAPGASTGTGATIPVTKINALANILAACVNSSGTGACDMLFADSTPAGGTAPTNTLDAAVNIARNPSNRVAALFALVAPTSPFQPMLSAAPPDWTLSVRYSGGGLDGPGSVAIDSSGNVWVANYFNSVSEFSNAGAAISPAGGFTGGSLRDSYGIAIDASGSIWVTNEQTPGINGGNGSLTVLNSSGQVTSGADGYFGGGVYFPTAAAGDTDGSIWVANYGNSTASKLSSSGSPISGSSGFGSPHLESPVAVAIDGSHRAWFANYSTDDPGTVTSISADGSVVASISCCGDAPSGIAIDAITASGVLGHIWIANFYGSSASELELTSGGNAEVVANEISGGGLNHPNGIALDGAGNVWLTNYHGNSITELEGAKGSAPGQALSSSSGMGLDADLSMPYGIAIDSSGNVWVSNFGSSMITQFVGAATPVKTPLLGPVQLP